MKNIAYLVILFLVFCGCATVSGEQIVKKMKEDKGCENVISVEINKSIEESKEIVRMVAKEMNLAEKTKEETKGFVYCELKTFWQKLFGSFAYQKAAHYGFFFEGNSSNTMTTITIVENTSGKPKREAIAAGIKNRS